MDCSFSFLLQHPDDGPEDNLLLSGHGRLFGRWCGFGEHRRLLRFFHIVPLLPGSDRGVSFFSSTGIIAESSGPVGKGLFPVRIVGQRQRRGDLSPLFL